MNLSAVPSRPRQDDPRALRVLVEEKMDIIKRYQQQQVLLKASLLEHTTQVELQSKEMLHLQSELELAKKDAERWKIEAFQSLQNAVQPEDIVSSPMYKQLEETNQKQQIALEEIKKKHTKDLQEQEKRIRNEEAQKNALTIQVAKGRLSELEEKEKELKEMSIKCATMQETLRQQEEEYVDEPRSSTTHMLEAQLRQAEEHVLEQSEKYQRACIQLQLEIDRREKCRKCKKLHKKEQNL